MEARGVKRLSAIFYSQVPPGHGEGRACTGCADPLLTPENRRLRSPWSLTDFCALLRCAQAYGVRKGFIRALNGTTTLPSTRSAYLRQNAKVMPWHLSLRGCGVVCYVRNQISSGGRREILPQASGAGWCPTYGREVREKGGPPNKEVLEMGWRKYFEILVAR